METYPQTSIELVKLKASKCPTKIAFSHLDKNSNWQNVSFKQHLSDIKKVANYISDFKLGPQDRVAIIAPATYAWETADRAIHYNGLVTVGIDHKSGTDDINYILEISQVKGLFVYDKETFNKIESKIKNNFKFICYVNDYADSDNFNQIISNYKEADYQEKCKANDNLACLFTSGTTGKPKGIFLKHHQYMMNCKIFEKRYQIFLCDNLSTIAWFSLHNSTGRVLSVASFFLETQQYIISDPKEVFNHIKNINPSYLVLVPRVFEKVHQKVLENIRNSNQLNKILFQASFKFCQLISNRTLRNKIGKTLFKKIHFALFGNNIEIIFCGSAPVSKDILAFFQTIGINIFEVYGQSEFGHLTATNFPHNTKIGSVGRPLDEIEYKFTEDNELLVRSSGMFSGYFPENGDEEVFTEDGFFKTGDIGEIIDGFLFLKGRKKEIIKTSTGIRISPVQIEQIYMSIPEIEQMVVIGDNQKFLTALIYFKSEAIKHKNEIISFLETEFKKLSHRLPQNRQISKFHLLEKPLSIEDGEITSTLKYRRKAIELKYSKEIEALYRES